MSRAISPLDVEAYAEYAWFCGHVEVTPMPFTDWLRLTDFSVFLAWQRFHHHCTHDKNKNLNADGKSIPKSGVSAHDRGVLADMHQQFGKGVNVGVLRRGGSLGGVRRESRAVSEERKASFSPLTFRTCHKCRHYLHATRFAKQGNSTRAICKACDSKTRVARRRERN